jgi:bacterial/archaeal transporter family-2 protein
MGWLAFPFALVAGALITFQTGSNARLKEALGHPLPSVIVNYIVGIFCVGIYSAASRIPIPGIAQAGTAPWWAWIGGLFGAIYGVAAVFLAHPLGAATLTALVVTGQLVCSVVLDHFGWIGFDVHPAGWGRITGCALMVTGLLLIAKF